MSLTAGCGGDSDQASTAPTVAERDGTSPEAAAPAEGQAPEGGEQREGSAGSAARREAVLTVRSYVGALSRREGRRLCELLTDAAIRELDLPRRRGSCAESMSASIGYRDPRGLPVFRRAGLSGVGSVQLDDDEARVTATVVTVFADRREPSIEDDLIYLSRSGSGWKIAQPSSTLYRAIGQQPPPAVLTPP